MTTCDSAYYQAMVCDVCGKRATSTTRDYHEDKPQPKQRHLTYSPIAPVHYGCDEHPAPASCIVWR